MDNLSIYDVWFLAFLAISIGLLAGGSMFLIKIFFPALWIDITTDQNQEQAQAYHSTSHPAQATFNITDCKPSSVSCDLETGMCEYFWNGSKPGCEMAFVKGD